MPAFTCCTVILLGVQSELATELAIVCDSETAAADDGTAPSGSPPVLCSTVRFGAEAAKSPLAATDLVPIASTLSYQKSMQESRVVLEPFEATQESQVEQLDAIVIAETAGFSQACALYKFPSVGHPQTTQEPDSPAESNTEVHKELDTTTGTGSRLVEPAEKCMYWAIVFLSYFGIFHVLLFI
ncbi:unnamed protein product [Dibothriocephalus latus]|uniref:Uncharacterized protein n=1 Tax=Dibothriocephalus latus TaxID=60516 RepID=A0A3P7R8F4_DIBLA|nr:unnamed protein product [Dibothriocephalus latus]